MNSLSVEQSTFESESGVGQLIAINSPLGLALERKIPLVEELQDNPNNGNALFEPLIMEVKQALRDANGQPTLYKLSGAHPDICTPMQYGGFFLERDRELLREASNVVLWVEGGEGTYIDFVSDLPAEVFAWDAQATGVSVQQLRQMRNGLLASNDSEADIQLTQRVEAHV